MSEFTQSDTNEVIEITCSNEVLDISGGAEFKKTEKQLREEKTKRNRDTEKVGNYISELVQLKKI